MLLNNDTPVKCRKCENRFKCLTTDKKTIKCLKDGKTIEVKGGNLNLWGVDERLG